MRGTLIIGRLTFHEAWRRWVVLLALTLSVAFLALYGGGFGFLLTHAHPSVIGPRALLMRGVANFVLLAGLYGVHFLTVVLSIFIAADAIPGEIASHTIQTLVAKPFPRWQLVLGKWLGYSGMIGLYVALLSGGVLAVTFVECGYIPPHPLEAMGLLVLEAVVLISLALFWGSFLSTLGNGVALFLLYGLAFIGSWVEQIGSFLHTPAATQVGIVTSLLMPVEAMWRRAAYLLQPPAISSLGISPFSAFSVPNQAMVLYAAIYAAAALLLAMRAFSRRDL